MLRGWDMQLKRSSCQVLISHIGVFCWSAVSRIGFWSQACNKAQSSLPMGHYATRKIYLTNEFQKRVQWTISIMLMPNFVHSSFTTETEINQWLEFALCQKAFPLLSYSTWYLGSEMLSILLVFSSRLTWVHQEQEYVPINAHHLHYLLRPLNHY